MTTPRDYLGIGGNPIINFNYVWDPTGIALSVGDGVTPIATGKFRVLQPSDFASTTSLSVSGLSLTVGAVSITGAPIMTLTGNVPVSVISMPVTHNVAVTGGSIQTIVTGTIGGNVTVSSVSVTGSTSGGALGSLDLTRTYLGVSGVNTLNVLPLGGFVGITGTVNTSASVTVGNVTITGFNSTIAPLAVSGTFAATIGNVSVTGGTSGANLGSLDLTHTYVATSGLPPTAGTGPQGLSSFRAPTSAPLLAAPQTVKTSAGNVFGMCVINPNTLPIYVKFFNATTGNLVVGTTVPQMVRMVPANDSTNDGQLIIEPEQMPLTRGNFSTAISVLASSVRADTGTQTTPSIGLLAEIAYA